MKFILKIIFVSLLSPSIFAGEPLSVEEDYHRCFDKITKIPADSVAIPPCNKDEIKKVVDLLMQSGVKVIKAVKSKPPESTKLFDGYYYYTDSGELYDAGDFNTGPVEMYRGDFNNEGLSEYAFISHGNLKAVYKDMGDHLLYIPHAKVIIDNLVPHGDLSKFYLSVASPFAITKNGKTYLRFMDIPIGATNFDKTLLKLCTYLWQGNKFKLAGPNLKISKSGNKIIEAKDCIGAR